MIRTCGNRHSGHVTIRRYDKNHKCVAKYVTDRLTPELFEAFKVWDEDKIVEYIEKNKLQMYNQ